MPRRQTRLTEDERVNIRLRRAAGETQRSVADDYGISDGTVKEVCLTEAERQRKNRRRYAMARARRNTPEFCARLRAWLCQRYEKVTGRNLVADLMADNPCLSPHSSLRPPATNTATRKHSFSGWPLQPQNSSPM